MKSFKEFKKTIQEAVGEEVGDVGLVGRTGNEAKEPPKEFEEDRRPTVDYEYRTKTDKLTQKESDDVAKVVAVLKKKQSDASLKLAKAFLSVDARAKQLKEKLEELKTKIRGEVVEKYFDASDEAFTRVIEMADAVITISKKTMMPGGEKFNADAFYKELLEIMPNVATTLEELKKKHTEILPDKEKASTISVKGEAFSPDEIKRFFEMVIGKLLSIFDTKFAALKRKYGIDKEVEAEEGIGFMGDPANNATITEEEPNDIVTLELTKKQLSKLADVLDTHMDVGVGGGSEEGWQSQEMKELSKLVSEKLKNPFVEEENMNEAAPPDQEEFIRDNKEKFKKEYGSVKGLEVLYKLAWKRHKENKK